MGLIDISNVTKKFNDEILFSSLSFSLNKESKLALIGNNGVGKTTLLKMIIGEMDYDEGSINILNNIRVGYLSQVIIHDVNNTLYQEMLHSFDKVLDIKDKLEILSKKLEENYDDEELIKEYGNLEQEFERLGGYDYQYKIDMIISKFGFTKEDYDRKITSFSGGEKNKVAFSRLLLDKPDVLILDEPTNHLDMNTVEWLEEYLKSYDGALIIVSHDRYFIDNVCNCVYEIDHHKGEYYKGNYSYYLQEKVTRYEQRLKAYNLQEKEIEHLNELIKRFKPKPTKTTFAKDREKKLNKILENKIDKPTNYNKKVAFNLKSEEVIRYKQLGLKDLEYGYDKALGSKVNLTIFNGDKIGIIGENGIGKTTLLKTIYKTIKPISGSIVEYRGLKIGYIDQNVIQISGKETIFDYFHAHFPYLENYYVYKQLGSYLFSDEDVLKSVDSLSGGEKVRLAFSILLMNKYDILLLDEPTNHLDIETRKVLESALVEYEGTIIFVSHDRYFVDELAKKLLILKKDSVDIFDGDYSMYLESLKLNTKELSKGQVILDNKKDEKIVEKPKKVKNLSKEKIEDKINKLQAEIDLINEMMYEEEYYTDQAKMNELDEQITHLKYEISVLEEQYLEILSNEEK